MSLIFAEQNLSFSVHDLIKTKLLFFDLSVMKYLKLNKSKQLKVTHK